MLLSGQNYKIWDWCGFWSGRGYFRWGREHKRMATTFERNQISEAEEYAVTVFEENDSTEYLRLLRLNVKGYELVRIQTALYNFLFQRPRPKIVDKTMAFMIPNCDLMHRRFRIWILNWWIAKLSIENDMLDYFIANYLQFTILWVKQG